MSTNPRKKRKLLIWLGVVVILGVAGGWFTWEKFFRTEPEVPWASESERFKYGTIGAEFSRGMPYYVWLVLPRVFPEYVPGPGGYKAFGLVWEEGHEMPVGFTKRRIGFDRVANNCATCHTGTWRSAPGARPVVVPGAPSHTTDIQGLLRFLTNCGNDPRFNASTILAEIDRETRLSAVDRLIYRFVLIPMTRKALQRQEGQFKWMNRPGWPEWGPGRDDPMNMTKYFMTSMPVDESTGQADFPSVWNLRARKGDGIFLNWSCDTPSVRSVVIDSALGLGAAPDPNVPFDGLHWRFSRRAWFMQRMAELEAYLDDMPVPPYPFPIDETLAGKGRPIYERACAECHDAGARFTGRPEPIDRIGTDRERFDTWTQDAADQANRAVASLGIKRIDMVKEAGYQNLPLDGIWMRAPYLHNGSVPNLRELLEPVEKRTRVFWRGYDVFDPVNVGFVFSGPEAERVGWRHDVSVRGDGNQGHLYGIDLSPDEKAALVEFMKTL